MFDYAERRGRLAKVLEQEGVDALFLGLSSDLEYLTGLERNIPTFGNVSYKEPTYLLPRMFAVFDLPHGAPGELVVVNETDDGQAMFDKVAKSMGGVKSLAIGSRLWGEPATPREVQGRARRDDEGMQDRRRHDGRRNGCGEAWSHDARAGRAGRARDALARLPHTIVHDAHHVDGHG